MEATTGTFLVFLCFAAAMATETFEGHALLEKRDAYDYLENMADEEKPEQKKREYLQETLANLLTNSGVTLQKRQFEILCINPATNQMCWCDANNRGAGRFRGCGLRQVLLNSNPDDDEF